MPRTRRKRPNPRSLLTVFKDLKRLCRIVEESVETLQGFEANERRRAEAEHLIQVRGHLLSALELLESPLGEGSTVNTGGDLLASLLADLRRATLFDSSGGAGGAHVGDGLALAEFLGFLATTDKSGVLTARSSEENYVLELTSGDLVYAHGDAGALRIGERLVENGALTAKDLGEHLGRGASRPGEFLGDALVRRNLIDEEALTQALSDQMSDVVERLLGESEVRYSFQAERTLVSEPQARLRIQPLLFELARRQDESRPMAG